MGAIARNIANNITTSGVFTSSAITNSSVTGITVLANASDGITFISSQTASASASLSFTGLSSTYKAYKFVFRNIHAITNNTTFQFNLSTDSGSNYNVNKTTTFFNAMQTESGTNPSLNYDGGHDLGNSTSYQNIARNLKNDADTSASGTLTLFNPSSTTYVKHFLSSFNGIQFEDYCQNWFVAGHGNTASAINAIRFQMDSGNFDGTIYMYGIK